MKRLAILPIEPGPSPFINEVHFYSNGNALQYAGIFSFAFYYHKDDKHVQDTHWFRGLNLYIQIVHNPDYAFYKDVGVVIYTDLHTFHILKDIWKYPKLVLAVTRWQRYQDVPNSIDGSIMRCMRFHALQAFPDAWVAIRDADTLFQKDIGLHIGLFGTSYMVDMNPELPSMLAKWEEIFLGTFFERIEQSICIGTALYYAKPWHANIARNYTIRRNSNIRIKSSNNWHLRKQQNVEFQSLYGAYAGFITCKPTRPSLWEDIVKYLIQRYKMVQSSQKIVISNAMYQQASIGKDERIVLFSIVANNLEECYFYVLPAQLNKYSFGDFYPYYWRPSFNRTKALHIEPYTLINTLSIDQVIRANAHQVFYEYFTSRLREYKSWLEHYNDNENIHMNTYLGSLEKNGYKKAVTRSNIFLDLPNSNAPTNTLELPNAFMNKGNATRKCLGYKCAIQGGKRTRKH